MEKDLYSQEEEKKEEKWHYSFVIFLMNNMGDNIINAHYLAE